MGHVGRLPGRARRSAGDCRVALGKRSACGSFDCRARFRESGASVASGPTPSVRCVDLAIVGAIVVIIESVAVIRIAVRAAEARPEAGKAIACAEATRESRTASNASSSESAEPSSTESAAYTSDVTPANPSNMAAAEAAPAAPRLRAGSRQAMVRSTKLTGL